MKGKIKIILVIIAHLLNFTHDVIHHEHDAVICCDIILPFFNQQNELDECHHNESDDHNNENGDQNHSSHHHHIIQFQDKVHIRNIVINLLKYEIELVFNSNFKIQDYNPFKYISKTFDLILLYQSIIGTNNCLRAPPVV